MSVLDASGDVLTHQAAGAESAGRGAAWLGLRPGRYTIRVLGSTPGLSKTQEIEITETSNQSVDFGDS